MGGTRLANQKWQEVFRDWGKVSTKESNTSISAEEYARTTAEKRKAKKKGKQFSSQPKAIAKKTALYRRFHELYKQSQTRRT